MKTIIKKRFTKTASGVIKVIDLFDKKGNRIYSKSLNGIKMNWYYDENNNLIHFKDSTGYEYWNTYDKYNTLISNKNFNNKTGYTYEYKYGDDCIICKFSDREFIIYTKHDERGNEIYQYNTDLNLRIWKEYNKDNKLISYKDSKGIIEVYEYDHKGNEVYMKRINPNRNSYYEYFKIYDSYGNLIEFKDSNDVIEYFEYEFYE